MKKIVILSIFLFHLLTNSIKNDYIKIEYVGNTDKLMHVIYISKKPIPHEERIITTERGDMTYNYIVYNTEFLFINKVINATIRKPFDEKDYNGFKITIHEKDNYVSYFITRKNSDSLFLRINAHLKKHKRNKELIQALTIQRIGNVFPD